MKYRIKITYDTGDSFRNEYGIESYIEFEWENLDIAKENLKRIEAHYEYYQKLNGHLRYKSNKTDQEIKGQYSREDWYVEEFDFQLKLQLDDLRFVNYIAFWCGYFETLVSAEITPNIPNDMKFEI